MTALCVQKYMTPTTDSQARMQLSGDRADALTLCVTKDEGGKATIGTEPLAVASGCYAVQDRLATANDSVATLRQVKFKARTLLTRRLLRQSRDMYNLRVPFQSKTLREPYGNETLTGRPTTSVR